MPYWPSRCECDHQVKPGIRPHTRSDLQQWVRERLDLRPSDEHALLEALDNVVLGHERLWKQSKEEAIRAVCAGSAKRLNRLRDEITTRDATVSTIARYFEFLVTDLTDQVHRDPKTQLMNSPRFLDQLETFLALEQRGPWCAVGLVDITSFKSYNDTLGHAVGDRIIGRVAQLLREQVRSGDLLARDAPEIRDGRELHARFGGDEFCFLIPDLDHAETARLVAERFRTAVECHDWSTEDARLASRRVTVDVGVVCLRLDAARERQPIARQLAEALLARADTMMYMAKGTSAADVYPMQVRVEQGRLVEFERDERPK